MTIKKFYIEYDAINSRNTFTNGDTINGRIILETNKTTKVQSLGFQAKGKARVRWSEYHGNNHTRVYWAKEKYYSIKHDILREASQDGSEIVGKGRHVFPFSFKIPNGKMPSTFHSTVGRVVHNMKAELKQSMKLTKKSQSPFIFVSKPDMDMPGLMVPQHGSNDKSLAFGSGNVSFGAYIKKMGYVPGEPINISIEINNHSSRSVKPKFELYEKRSFFAQGRRKLETNKLLKGKDKVVDSYSGKKTVKMVIPVPALLPSILNCSIIKVEYRLKVYLKVKYAANPQVKFPIVILQDEKAEKTATPVDALRSEAFGNPSHPTWSTTPQAMDAPPSYEELAMYPPIPSAEFKTAL